ncbi:uncharacterized protein METZ01_LOCUS455582 [marine metagenome]|uniref:Uncharacterized protein n=1 Tax=marine metagenome TaxID=408172 RepID=A0A383A6U4_9ZZZZ
MIPFKNGERGAPFFNRIQTDKGVNDQ